MKKSSALRGSQQGLHRSPQEMFKVTPFGVVDNAVIDKELMKRTTVPLFKESVTATGGAQSQPPSSSLEQFGGGQKIKMLNPAKIYIKK